MKDEVAAIVADRIIETVETLQRHGMHRVSIVAGVDLALRRMRERDAKEVTG